MEERGGEGKKIEVGVGHEKDIEHEKMKAA